jgi:MoaA/NifB/PqqE/SkfB family radical SAM enzyme
METKQRKSFVDTICDKIKSNLTESIKIAVEEDTYGDLCDLTDEAYDLGYEEGMEEGEIIQILRQQNPNFDPWSDEGDKARTELREQRAKQYRANARKARKEAREKAKLDSSVQKHDGEKKA